MLVVRKSRLQKKNLQREPLSKVTEFSHQENQENFFKQVDLGSEDLSVYCHIISQKSQSGIQFLIERFFLVKYQINLTKYLSYIKIALCIKNSGKECMSTSYSVFYF